MEDLQKSLLQINSIDEVCHYLNTFLKQYSTAHTDKKIIFVTGVITSDGPEHVEENRKKLFTATECIRSKTDGFVFCWEHIFTDGVKARINYNEIPYEDFLVCSKDIIESCVLTDVYMTYGWERSTGARLEHDTALTKKIPVHYI